MIESSQIERMSVTERLQAMDQLWDSLNNRHGDDVPSPDWHQDVWLTGGASSARRSKVPDWTNSDPVYEALNHDRSAICSLQSVLEITPPEITSFPKLTGTPSSRCCPGSRNTHSRFD